MKKLSKLSMMACLLALAAAPAFQRAAAQSSAPRADSAHTARPERWQISRNDGTYLWELGLLRAEGDTLVVAQGTNARKELRVALADVDELRLVQPSIKQMGRAGRGAYGGLVGADDAVYKLSLLSPAERRRVVGELLHARTASTAPTVALVDFSFYGKRANSIEPGDSTLSDSATARVRRELRDAGLALLDAEAVRRAEGSAEALAVATGRPCNVVVACAREVGRELGARFVVMGKVSKTSNLIWLFSAQLIDVGSGELLMDDEYELKGISADMVPTGARVFARRAAKKMTGGEATAARP